MIKAAAYCRYSSDNQREESIDAQLRAIKEYCTKNDYTLVATYVDEARSATSDDRPQFLNLMEDANTADYQIVIVHKLDRFARNRYDSAFYRKKLKDCGTSVVSVLENLDDSPESVILESVLEGMAEYYSKNLSREVKKGMKENALKVKHNGGIPALGYNVVNGEYVINEDEAESVRLIFKWYLDGFGYAAIAKKLNDEGRRSKFGGPFNKVSIRDVLLKEKYTGLHIFALGMPNEIRVEDGLPVIVSKEIFEAAAAKIKSRVRGPRMNAKQVYYLTGLMKCGECGASFGGDGYVNGRSKVYYQYGCVNYRKNKSCSNTQLRKDYIEDAVIANIKEIFFTDESIERIAIEMMAELKKLDKSKKTERERLEKLKASAQSKIDKLFEMFYANLVDSEILGAQINKIKIELTECDDRLAAVSSSMSDVSKSSIIQFLKYHRSNLDNDDPVVIRKVIETFVSEITVYVDRIDVVFKIDPAVRGKVGGGEGRLTYPRTIKRPSSNRW